MNEVMRTARLLLPFLLLAPSYAACGGGGAGGAGGTGGETSSNQCIVDPESCMGTCAGQCAPVPHGFAQFMMYLWSGPAGSTPPACPEEAPNDSPGFLDAPPDSVTCSQCLCAQSEGGCYPPYIMKANSAACPGTGPGVSHTPFDAAIIWDGTCTSQDAVSSADSVTVSPPDLDGHSECPAGGTKPTDIQGGGTISRICSSFSPEPDGKCPNDQICAYRKVDGFSVCVPNFNEDVPCPPGWPVKHLHYDESELCNCSCGKPVGEMCNTTVTVYEDGACTKPLGSTVVTAGKPSACIDLPPGSALGSKTATALTYTAGTCTPKVTKNKLWTLCCLADD